MALKPILDLELALCMRRLVLPGKWQHLRDRGGRRYFLREITYRETTHWVRGRKMGPGLEFTLYRENPLTTGRPGFAWAETRGMKVTRPMR